MFKDDVKKQIPRKEEGPIKVVDISKVPKESPKLPGGYEWVTMDLTNDAEVCLIMQNISTSIYSHKPRFRSCMNFFPTITLKMMPRHFDSTIRLCFLTGKTNCSKSYAHQLLIYAGH